LPLKKLHSLTKTKIFDQAIGFGALPEMAGPFAVLGG
jgi:hypothetical protein